MSSKKQQTAVAKEDGVAIPMHVANVLGYIRFGLILASWPFAMKDAHTFLCLYATAYALGMLHDLLAAILGQHSFFGTQWDILMTRFATSSLIFVVLKLGLEVIKDEWERMSFAFLFASIFLGDFVSYWFQVYSSYLLDEESHVTPNPIVQGFLRFLKVAPVAGVMNLLAELYIVDHYLAFFHNHPMQRELTGHQHYPLFLQATLAGIVLKSAHNVLHLAVSAIRIVKLDVR